MICFYIVESFLQNMLQCFDKWCVKYQWKLDKTEVVHFRLGPKTRKSTIDYNYRSNVLEIVSSCMYLGLIFLWNTWIVTLPAMP